MGWTIRICTRRILATAIALALICAFARASASDAPATSESPAAAPAPSAPSAPAAPAPPTPIKVSDIPRAAIAADTRIRALRSVAGRSRETDEIAVSSVSVLASVARLEEWMRTRDPRQQTNRALSSLAQEWRLNEDLLARWMETTGQRLDALAAATAESDALDAKWIKTADAFEGQNVPLPLVERTHGIVASLDEVVIKVREQTEAALLLQSKISSAKLDSEEALESITAMIREEHKALFKLDSPPLWNAFGEEGLTLQIGESFRENLRALDQYLDRAGSALQFQLALYIVLAFVFFRLKRRSQTWPKDDKGILACTRLVARPFFGALLVALLSGLWIHPRAPLVFYELSSALLAVPVVVLMAGVVQRRVRGALYLLALIFVAERVWESTSSGSLLERSVLLVMTLISAAVLAWTITPPPVLNDVVTSRWWKAVTIAGRVALAGLAVSALANIAGNVSLARLITATVIRAAYWAVVLYAAALLLRGTAALLVRSPALAGFRTIQKHADLIVRRARLIIDMTAVSLLVVATINAAGQWTVLLVTAKDGLTHRWGYGGVRFSFGSVLVFVLAVVASIVLSRLICALLQEDVYPRVSLPRGLPDTVTTTVRYTVIAGGFLFASAIVGIPLDRMAFVLGAFSVGIGFGLQTVINHFVSGLILMFERPIQVGDVIDVAGLTGRVRHIGVRATRIDTSDGAEVIVPNGTLVSNSLVNWTLSSLNRRIEIQASVPQSADAERVLGLMREAVSGQPDVLAKPAPTALLRKLGADTAGAGVLELSVFFWTSAEDWPRVRSEMTVRINQALRGAPAAVPAPPPDIPGVTGTPARA